MRLDYVSDPPEFTDPEEQALVERIRARRPGGKLLDLDRTLLVAPGVAEGWNSFLGAIRTQPSNSLPESIRQVAIARTVALNRAWFAWPAHHDLLLSSSDTPITTEAIEYILTAPPKSPHILPHTETSIGGLEERHLAIIAYVDYMTKDVVVPDEVFERVRGCGFSEREIVEITACSCAYNLSSRFLWGLEIGEGVEYGVMSELPKAKKGDL